MPIAHRVALSLLLLFPLSSASLGQSNDDFFPLFRGDPYQDWEIQNADKNTFSLEQGVLTVQGDQGWLLSPRQYDNFILRLEFQLETEESVNNILFRVGPRIPGTADWTASSYGVTVANVSEQQSPDAAPLASVSRTPVEEGEVIYPSEDVADLYRGAGVWHAMEISVVGTQINVRLNGEEVTLVQDVDPPRGFIGFLTGAGVVRYRNMMITEF